MRFFRRHKYLRIHLILIGLAVFLRSFIAPGFMLSISADGGLGLAFCDGPVVMYQSSDSHDHHSHDGNEGEAESHISTSCSFWSTSSVMVFNTVFEAEPVIVSRHQNQIIYRPSNLQRFIPNSRVTRGPPAYS
ncbi:MAG: hypothetical protein ACI9ZT_001409 [Gammaproteobacteria bacterium]|jgi:hypothetical protein